LARKLRLTISSFIRLMLFKKGGIDHD